MQAKHREIYEQFYSLMRLRRMSEKRHLADRRHADLWPALLATFRLFEAGGPGAKMGLPPLAGDLFSPPAIGILARCTLGNDVLLGALRALNLYTHPDNGQLIRVNYGALNVEEFGSVYEGLLEYEPIILPDGSQTSFEFRKGDERANTGSHYTPDELVQPLIKHSLDHLIAERLKATNPEAALLELRVVDVACGSGHILLAAARRIGHELAIVRTGEDQPSPLAMRTAVRDVIRHCIYGVDLNPLAVELCKVALWLEAHVPGEPLSFLDHHIKCGNAIVGYARRDDIEARGVPDEAFATMPGDDKDVAAALRQRNKAERAGQTKLKFDPEVERRLDEALKGWRGLDALPEHTSEQVEAKRKRFEALAQSAEALWMEQLAAIPIAQFYIPKLKNRPGTHVTEEEFRRYWKGERKPLGQATAEAWAMAERKRFFHWFLAFPDVMDGGGFDCILGNPPYLGGKKISGTFGDSVLAYLMWSNESTGGLCDLVTYFIRRQYALLREGGFIGLITTNSISEGDTRAGGLAHIMGGGASIAFAVRSMRWPGRAVLEVSLLAIKRGEFSGKRSLNGKPVVHISSRLDEDPDSGDPARLAELSGRSYVGSIISGKGFLLERSERDALSAEVRNLEVIKTYIGGDDVVRRPDQSPSRFVIDFGDMAEEVAATYIDCFQIVRERVWPDRKDVKKDVYRNRWWQFAERQARLYESIRHLAHVLVIPQTARWLTVSLVPNHGVFAFGLALITTDRFDIFAVLHSVLHYEWVRRYSSSLKTDLRYTPSDSFETFPFPTGIWESPDPTLIEVGRRYHEHRRLQMRDLWLGLTEIYNLLHARDLSPELVAKVSKKPADVARKGYEGLVELRRQHVALNSAVRDAYGWIDLDLGHGLIEVETLPENDRVRYTISPAARKEVLKRLLALNHQRAKEEAAKAALVKPKGGKKSTARLDPNQPDLI